MNANQTTTECNDQASAIRWLIENRRPEITLFVAIQRLRCAMHGDAQAQSTLDAIELESAPTGA